MSGIAVFRALVLGDLLCATPALRALRHGFPEAQITLVGLPWARELAERLASVDDFIAFPGWPGLPERPLLDARALPPFFAQVRSRRFDLALQLHGSGRIVNPLVAAFGARHTATFCTATEPAPIGQESLAAPWPTAGTEIERLLSLTDHLGLPRRGLHLDFPLHDLDRVAAERLCAPLRGRPFVIVHPGAQLPSRRWPVERFAAVADAIAAQGLAIVLTGTPAEAGLTRAVADAMQASALDLTARTSLWQLGALVEWAALVLANDTGISHVAAALGTPSVIVSSGGDARRWMPLDAQRHRVLWRDMDCRPCAYASCPIGHGCALGVGVADVQQAALQALSTFTARQAVSTSTARQAGSTSTARQTVSPFTARQAA